MSLTIIKLHNICQNKAELMKKLQEWKLMPCEGEFMCPACENPLRLALDTYTCDGYQWKCNHKVSIQKQKRRRCGHQRSIRKGTFFDSSKLSIFQILGFIHLWVMNAQLTFISSELEISFSTCVTWSGYCRDVLLCAFFQDPQKLGGPEKVVEIHESRFVKRKYLRGRFVEGHYVFGGYERGTCRLFMVAVEQRNSGTLEQLIEQWVDKGTTIYSAFFRSSLCDDDFDYLTTNHSITFKDPETGDHADFIESCFRHEKSEILSNSRGKANIPDYLAKYMFFRKCNELQLDRTTEFFALAGNWYDPQVRNVEILLPAPDDYYSSENEEEKLEF